MKQCWPSVCDCYKAENETSLKNLTVRHRRMENVNSKQQTDNVNLEYVTVLNQRMRQTKPGVWDGPNLENETMLPWKKLLF